MADLYVVVQNDGQDPWRILPAPAQQAYSLLAAVVLVLVIASFDKKTLRSEGQERAALPRFSPRSTPATNGHRRDYEITTTHTSTAKILISRRWLSRVPPPRRKYIALLQAPSA